MVIDHDVALRVAAKDVIRRRRQFTNVYGLVRNVDAQSGRHGRALTDRR